MRFKLREGRKGLEIFNKNMVVEEGSPKFNELMNKFGDSIEIEGTPTKTSTRMAGDELTPELELALDQQITEVLYGDVDYEDANMSAKNIKDLAKQLARYARHDHAFEQAGLNSNEIEQVLTANRLSNGAASPFIRNEQRGNHTIERRVFANEVVNPATKEKEIAPFMDKDNAGVALSMEFGDGKKTYRNKSGQIVPIIDLEGHTLSQEYIAEKMMKLAGMNPKRNNTVNVNAPDFAEGNKIIDAESISDVYSPNEVDIQVYTDLGMPGQGDSAKVAGKINEAINSEMMSNPQITLQTAINNLTRDNKISQGHYPEGKLIKKEGNKYAMNALIEPRMNHEDYRENANARLGKKFQMVHHPVGGFMVDLDQARESILKMRGPEILNMLKVNPNRGYNGDRWRGRVYVSPSETSEFVTDLSIQNPNVAQMFK